MSASKVFRNENLEGPVLDPEIRGSQVGTQKGCKNTPFWALFTFIRHQTPLKKAPKRPKKGPFWTPFWSGFEPEPPMYGPK